MAITIYDAGQWADRYTVIINGHIFAMSEDANSPQGVNLYCGYEPKDNKYQPQLHESRISLRDLNDGVRIAIQQRRAQVKRDA